MGGGSKANRNRMPLEFKTATGRSVHDTFYAYEKGAIERMRDRALPPAAKGDGEGSDREDGDRAFTSGGEGRRGGNETGSAL
ncbi:hypothetical protein NL676_020263 [Syzygium grande]|nr:hypothetical protein NL676_020263 [Syzygium grande]